MLKAWEVQLKDSNWELYALDTPEDFDFRVKDFGPDLVVVSENITEFAAQIPVVLLTFEEGEGLRIKKPLNISDLESILDEVFAQKSH